MGEINEFVSSGWITRILVELRSKVLTEKRQQWEDEGVPTELRGEKNVEHEFDRVNAEEEELRPAS